MGRRKEVIVRGVSVPKSTIEWLGEPLLYKQAHFLSMLSRHIIQRSSEYKAHFYKPIDFIYLKHHYGDNYLAKVITPLVANEWIEVDHKYSADGHKCKGYRLTQTLRKEVMDLGLDTVKIHKATFIKRIDAWNTKRTRRQLLEHPFLLREAEALASLPLCLNSLKHIYEGLLLDEKNTPDTYSNVKSTNIAQLYSYWKQIQMLGKATEPMDTGIYYKLGRVYHPLVLSRRRFRDAVLDDNGNPFTEVDLRASQAVFLCKVMTIAFDLGLMKMYRDKAPVFADNLIETLTEHINSPCDIFNKKGKPTDFMAFCSAVIHDDLYEDVSPKHLKPSSMRIAGAANLSPEERKGAKEKFFKDIFFYRFKHENSRKTEELSISSEYLQSFNDMYPSVFWFCKECARQSKEYKSSRDLSLLLQAAEGSFFHKALIDAIYKTAEIPFFIVHDAIYVADKHKDLVITTANEVAIKELGASPKFR